jgi:DNA-binding HxlR family transcriptional regulator
MTVPIEVPPPPRIALRPREAAASLGVAESYFNEHVRPELRVVRKGRKVLVPVRELERWAAENAEMPIAEEVAR